MDLQQLNQLFRALDSLQRQYDKLLTCVREQQTALVENNVQKLESLVGSIEALVSEVAETEQKRMDATSQLAVALGLESSGITAQTLAENLDALSGQRLLQRVDRLRQVVTDLAEVNDRNRLLTEQSAHFTQRTLEIIAQTVRGETYGRKAQAPRAVRTFDTRV